MRLSKTITIDDDRITVYEVIVEDLLSMMDASEADIRGRMDELLPKCTDLSMARMKKLAPSELKKVWDAFRDVNGVFFSLVEKLGITDSILREAKNAVLTSVSTGAASSDVSAG